MIVAFDNLNQIIQTMEYIDEIKDTFTTQEYLTTCNLLLEEYNILKNRLNYNREFIEVSRRLVFED